MAGQPGIVDKAPKDVYDLKDLPSSSDPFIVFRAWFEEAKECPSIMLPKTMCLATCSKDGKPSVRNLRMKEFDDTGILFVSFTNSTKGKEIEDNPFVGASFDWTPLGRQVTVKGRVEKVSRERTEAIFHSRSREIQILTAASPNQSSVIKSRSVLEEERTKLREEYKDLNSVIPCPEHWTGYKIIPSSFEFYHSHSDKLDFSDRFLFSKQNDGSWKVDRLAP